MGSRRAMRLRIAKIREAAKDRPPGYVEDVLSNGTVDGDWLEMPAETYKSLIAKYRPPQPPAQPPALPPLATMAKNAAQALADEAKARLMGIEALPEDAIDARLAICQSCEFFILLQKRCSKCGCFMEYKTRLRSQKCPVGKW